MTSIGYPKRVDGEYITEDEWNSVVDSGITLHDSTSTRDAAIPVAADRRNRMISVLPSGAAQLWSAADNKWIGAPLPMSAEVHGNYGGVMSTGTTLSSSTLLYRIEIPASTGTPGYVRIEGELILQSVLPGGAGSTITGKLAVVNPLYTGGGAGAGHLTLNGWGVEPRIGAGYGNIYPITIPSSMMSIPAGFGYSFYGATFSGIVQTVGVPTYVEIHGVSKTNTNAATVQATAMAWHRLYNEPTWGEYKE